MLFEDFEINSQDVKWDNGYCVESIDNIKISSKNFKIMVSMT